jgi:hypothetical protein
MAYELEGRLLEACTCEGSCPCWAGYGPNEDCHTVLSWHIDSGTIEGVDVSGRTVAVVGDVACSVFNQEDSSVALYVDDQAAPQQEEALLNAWTGRLGGPVADLARLFGEVTSTGRAPITVTADGGGRLKIGQEIQADTALLQEAEGRLTSIEESVLSAAPGATADWSEDPRSQEYNAVQASFRFQA